MTTNADLITEYKLNLLEVSTCNAMTALVCYEHLITFKYELNFLRNRKWTAATWIFVVNRYFLLANTIYAIMPISAQVLCIHAFAILRVFAFIQDRFWKLVITSILVVLTLIELTVQSYANFTNLWVSIIDPVLGSICVQSGFTIQFATVNSLYTAVSIVSVISAALVLVITLVKTARQLRQASFAGIKTVLSEILLRDGSMFFILILLQDLFNTVPSLNSWLFGGPAGPIMIPLLTVLPPILLSRFIINLREAGSTNTNSTAGQFTSRFSNPNFRMPTMDEFLGNLGEPLDYVEYQQDDDDGVSDEHASASASQDQVSTETHNRSAGLSSYAQGNVEVDILVVNDLQLEERLRRPGSIALAV